MSMTNFAQALAIEIFQIDPPTLFLRQVGREVMLSPRRALADACDIMSDLDGQTLDVLRVPGLVLDDRTSLGEGRERAEIQNDAE